MNLLKSLILAVLISVTWTIQAQKVYTLVPAKEPVRMGNNFIFLRDSTHNMALENALKNANYKENKEDVPNYDVTSDALWGKIKFVSNDAADWYLTLDPPSFDEITFYQKRGNKGWEELKLGNAIPQDKIAMPPGHYSVKLDVKPGDTALFLFRVYDSHPMQFDIKVGTLETFAKPFHNADLYNGICFGVMIMMLIYNLYLFLAQKQRVYIYYVLYVLFNGIFLFNLFGYSSHLPGFLQSTLVFDSIIFPGGFGIFLLLFTLKLFNNLIPKGFIKVIYFFMLAVLVNIIIGAWGSKYFAFNMIRVLGLVLGILCLTSGIIALRKGSNSAKFYIIGFGVYLSGLAFIILSGHLIPANSVALMALLTGSMMECVFLSFAQADKLKIAQRETLAQAQENARLVKEQNIVLEEKVQQRTAELAEKNKEITDSIRYAKRIQNTLLAHEMFLKDNLPEHFILFKPKDIVSGDFYWAAKKGNKVYIAICDSTGHGVPGAFMSLLNISFLNEAINEKNISAPNEVLNHVRARLIENISRDGGKDGMDGILACIEKSEDGIKLSYAAAYNEPVLIRNGSCIELGADKMPVGQGEKTDSFTLHEVEMKKDDILYLATDGYADQFGGPSGKKFKYKQFLEKLLSITHSPIPRQKTELDEAFEKWRGNLEQVDDVLVVGIRV